MNIPKAEIIPKEILAALAKGADYQDYKISDDIDAVHDKYYKCYRFKFGSGAGEVLNFWLDDKQENIIRISTASGANLEDSVARVISAGGLKREAIAKLGFDNKAVDKMAKEQRETKKALELLQTGDLNKLPNSAKYPGTKTNTENVVQGEAIIIDLKGNKDLAGLCTFDAGPCSALILTSKNKDGSLKKIALAHIDDVVKEQDIKSLVTRMGDDPALTTATIISGHATVASVVQRALNQTGIKIAFANIDPEGDRSDAVAVDRQGTVYYGERPDLKNFDDQFMSTLKSQRQLAAALSRGGRDVSGRLNIKSR